MKQEIIIPYQKSEEGGNIFAVCKLNQVNEASNTAKRAFSINKSRLIGIYQSSDNTLQHTDALNRMCMCANTQIYWSYCSPSPCP